MKVKYIQLTTERLIRGNEYEVLDVKADKTQIEHHLIHDNAFFYVEDELKEKSYFHQYAFIVTQI